MSMQNTRRDPHAKTISDTEFLAKILKELEAASDACNALRTHLSIAEFDIRILKGDMEAEEKKAHGHMFNAGRKEGDATLEQRSSGEQYGAADERGHSSHPMHRRRENT